MKQRLNVLITSVGSNTSICVIKGLKKQVEFDVFIVGVDTNHREQIAGSFLCDSFYTVPPANDEASYMETMQRIIKSESINLLIPINDMEHEVISRNIEQFTALTYVLISPRKTVEICNDKLKTYCFFKDSKIPTVKTYLPRTFSLNEIKNAGIAFPFFAKPRKGVGSKDTYEMKDKEDYLALIRRIPDPIIQEKALGQEYTIDVFCNNQTLIAAVPRRRIETRAGVSYKGETEFDPQLINYADKITKALGIQGPANIQCFKLDGMVRFIEVNPRFSGGLTLTIESGVNTPLFALKIAAGERLMPKNDFKIVHMCRYLNEVFYPVNGVNAERVEVQRTVILPVLNN